MLLTSLYKKGAATINRSLLGTLTALLGLLAGAALAQPDRPYLSVPAGDGVPLARAETDAFVRALCTSGLPQAREGCAQAGASTLALGENGLLFVTNFVLYGSFSRVGAQEALLGLGLAATDSGATSAVLFRRDGTRWRAVRFIEVGVRRTVLTFPARDGRTLVVSYGEGFETSTFDLQVTRFDLSEVSTSLILDYKNPFPSCGSPPATGARHAQVVDWKREDRNEDSYLDLILEVSTLRVDAFACGAGQAFYRASQRPQTVEQIVFLFDGQRFMTTPGAERLKLFSQAPQGWSGRR